MNIKAILLALLAFAIFSGQDALVKSLGGTFSPFQIVFFSSLFSFPLVTMMMVRDATQGNLRPVHPWWVALRSICTVVTPCAGFFAFTQLPMTEVYALLFTMPLLITLLSIPILGERVGIWRMLAVFVGLGGVLVVMRPGDTDLQIGHISALVAALSGATASIVVRKIGREERRVVLMLYPLLISVFVMGSIMGFVYQPMQTSELAGMAAVAAFSFAATLLLVYAYTLGEAVTVAPMQYSQIIWALVLGYYLFGEPVDTTTLIGVGIIIASGLFIILREAIGGSQQTPVLRTRSRGLSPGGFAVSQGLKQPPRKQ